MYTYIYIYTYTNTHRYTDTRAHTHIQTYIRTYIYTQYIYIHTSCTHTYIYICVFIHNMYDLVKFNQKPGLCGFVSKSITRPLWREWRMPSSSSFGLFTAKCRYSWAWTSQALCLGPSFFIGHKSASNEWGYNGDVSPTWICLGMYFH